MNRLSAFGCTALLLLPNPVRDGVPPPTPIALPLTVLTGTVPPRKTLATLLPEALSPAMVETLLQASRPVYNLARLSVGHPFSLTLAPPGFLAAFSYGIDELRTLHVERRGESLAASIEERRYAVTAGVVTGVVRSSLFGAVEDAGEDDTVAISMADVFAWDVDFHTELRRGDTFRVLVERLTLDGKTVRNGRILAAELQLGSRRIQAVYFHGAEGKGYYTPEGTPLHKAFLRSPLRYSFISSGFSHARIDPISGVLTPHLGIDYAAPPGTPVFASADGHVSSAGWYGGFGQTVRLRHPNGFETLYGHLSQILVAPGARVAQGDIIGRVGSTGHATGPHLDYRVFRSGVPLNPLTMDLPPGAPIPARDRPAFLVVRDLDLGRLESAKTQAD